LRFFLRLFSAHGFFFYGDAIGLKNPRVAFLFVEFVKKKLSKTGPRGGSAAHTAGRRRNGRN
jgi:hypothetical protein